MDKSTDHGRFMELLKHDTSFTDSEYKVYRMKLEEALTTARYREKVALRIVVVSFVVALFGVFAGGTRIFGSFDPGDQDATILSIGCGAVYCLAVATFWISLASYYSRFRVNVRNTQDELRDANIMALQIEISELKKEIEKLVRRNDSA